jgi:hypothetical protein
VQLPTSKQLTIDELERSQIAVETTRLVVPGTQPFFLMMGTCFRLGMCDALQTEAYEAACSSFWSTNASTPLA